MELTFLGTSSMVPTKDRNVLGHFLDFNGEGIMIDCGEGTQRQMNIAGINRLRVNKILLTHWHGDHVLGLVGFLQTLSHSENPPSIHLYGPIGSKENIDLMMRATQHQSLLSLEVTELNPDGVEKFFENENYYLECTNLEHPVQVLGFNFVEKDQRRIDMAKAAKFGIKEGPLVGKLKKGEDVEVNGKEIKADEVSYIQEGKKISFVIDTVFCENAVKLAEDADLLVCEATFLTKHEDRATDYQHMTAAQAATLASQANVKELVITHFSQRYKDVNEILEEASTIFPDTKPAHDFMKVKL